MQLLPIFILLYENNKLGSLSGSKYISYLQELLIQNIQIIDNLVFFQYQARHISTIFLLIFTDICSDLLNKSFILINVRHQYFSHLGKPLLIVFLFIICKEMCIVFDSPHKITMNNRRCDTHNLMINFIYFTFPLFTCSSKAINHTINCKIKLIILLLAFIYTDKFFHFFKNMNHLAIKGADLYGQRITDWLWLKVLFWISIL